MELFTTKIALNNDATFDSVWHIIDTWLVQSPHNKIDSINYAGEDFYSQKFGEKEVKIIKCTISSDKILIYPNHENIFKAAEQATAISGLDNVVIMPSKSVMECYYSLAMDNGDSSDLDNRISSLIEGCNAVTSILVTQCVKDCICNNVTCVKGQYVVLYKSLPIACVEACEDVVNILREHSFLSDKENCIIFTGKDIINFDEENMRRLRST